MAYSKRIVGIDFGTTTSAIGMVKDGVPFLFEVDEGEVMMPSVVAFGKGGEIIVGQKAKKQAVLNPEKTFRAVKRRMGEKETVNTGRGDWPLEQIGAEILKKLKAGAERQLGHPVADAVITVPAYFNQLQRQAVQEVGKLAGLNVLRIINEPTAAAMAYGLNRQDEQSVMVFDFGGGTFDVSVLTIADGVFEVKATGGDNMMGGDDIDQMIIDKVAADFKNDHGIDLTRDKMAMQKLRDEAEKLKIALSNADSARLNIPFITADKHGPIHIDKTFTQDQVEQMIAALVGKIIRLAKDTLKKSGLDNKTLDKILLAGGSTRIPAVRDAIVEHFGDKALGGVNPLECIALGAAVQAAILDGQVEDTVLLDIIPLSLGLEIEGGSAEEIIPANATIPVSHKKVFSTVADNQTEVEIKILQGNSNRAAENVTLGRFILGGIELAKKGEPKVEVEFDIDVNGIMGVRARDTKTGAARSVTIDRGIVDKRKTA
ncbi:MAG: Hsp70 family protein [Nitrospinae bacterium]|nr:Hsp70 family protein [Nitrospinota bacterium]